jgi:hypothetical protein
MYLNNPPISRRHCLAVAKTMLIGSALMGVVTKQSAFAASKADKRDFSYQEKPKDGKSCASCKMFSLAQGGVGTCAIVDGDVSPNGWCLAFTARAT